MQDGWQILLDMEVWYSLSCFYTDFRRYYIGFVDDLYSKARFHKIQGVRQKLMLLDWRIYLKTRQIKVLNIQISKIDSDWKFARFGL